MYQAKTQNTGKTHLQLKADYPQTPTGYRQT